MAEVRFCIAEAQSVRGVPVSSNPGIYPSWDPGESVPKSISSNLAGMNPTLL